MSAANAKASAAGFVAKAMANTHPSRRQALLAEMMGHCGMGLAVIGGNEVAAEEAFRLADHLSTRGAA